MCVSTSSCLALVVLVEQGGDEPVDVLGDGVKPVAAPLCRRLVLCGSRRLDGLVQSVAGQPALDANTLLLVRADKVGYQEAVEVEDVDHNCEK